MVEVALLEGPGCRAAPPSAGGAVPRTVLTPHARRRLAERSIEPEEVERVLLRPFLHGDGGAPGRCWLVAPSLAPDGRRRFLAVIVSEGAACRIVLTAFCVRRPPRGHLPCVGRRRGVRAATSCLRSEVRGGVVDR